MNLLSYLNQPFPKSENKWKTILFISIFVSLFLIIFQPFNINLMGPKNKTIFLMGYGIITCIILIINLIVIENLFPSIFKEQNWTIWKEFVWLFWVIFSIGIGNAFYTSIIFQNSNPDFQFIIGFQSITIVVAIIPITILIITKQKYLLRKHINSANDLNKSIDFGKTETHKSKIIQFYADNEKNFIEFDINDFYFIESSGNYIELYIFVNEKITRKTFRSTLKRSLDVFINIPEIIQCHRAFIVNTSKIINTKGNSQGLRLKLENCEKEVPVSRNYVDIIRSQIK